MEKMKVSHNYSDIDSDEEKIFVLKDQSVLDDGPDEIYNEEIRARSNQEKNAIIRNNAKGYVRDYTEEKPLGILEKYDNPYEIEEGFIIGEQIPPRSNPRSFPKANKEEGISLESSKTIASEFKDIKLPKKRRAKTNILGTERNHMEMMFQKRKQKKPVTKEKPLEEAILELTYEHKPVIEIDEGIEYNDTEAFLEKMQKPSKDFSNIKAPQKVTTAPIKTTEELHSFRGLSGCLEMIKSRGYLHSETVHGRAKDKDPEGSDLIVHRDTKGRVLSKKQAFRNQCYTSRKQRPKLNKSNKIQKRFETQMQIKKINPSKGSSTLQNAKTIMNNTGVPYVKLDNP